MWQTQCHLQSWMLPSISRVLGVTPRNGNTLVARWSSSLTQSNVQLGGGDPSDLDPEAVAEMTGRVSAECPTLLCQGTQDPPVAGEGAGRSLGTVGYQVEPAGDKKWFLPSTTSFLLPQRGQARARSSGKLPNMVTRRAKVGQEISEQTCEDRCKDNLEQNCSISGGREAMTWPCSSDRATLTVSRGQGKISG